MGLPYPHRRNDCMTCREQDADFAVDPASGRPLLLCQQCLGKHALGRVQAGGGRGLSDPVTITLAVAPARLADHGLGG